MFNLFSKKNDKKVIGTIERIGIKGCSEICLYYVFKLKNIDGVFFMTVLDRNLNSVEVALTKEGDEVEFMIKKDNNIYDFTNKAVKSML